MIKTIFSAYCYIFIQMSIVWLFSLLLKNPSIIDFFWPISLVLTGFYFLASNNAISSVTLIICLLLLAWGIRLAGYLWYCRLRKNHVDKRYVSLASGWSINQSLGYFINYQIQGVLVIIIALPFVLIDPYCIARFPLLTFVLNWIVIIGISGEMVADFQLRLHGSRYPGLVCNKGLWRYTRHPNYFFDWLTWCGFSGYAWFSTHGEIALLSPLMLFIIFNFMTGPLTEAGSIKSRGDAFIRYQQSTSFFFPWVKKKNV